MTGTIYLYAFANGRNYIGQTWDFAQRQKQHRKESKGQRHANDIFQSCVNKYGLPKPIILYQGITTQSELNRLESLCFDRYTAFYTNGGCNIREPGSHGKMSEKSKAKMSENNARYWKGKRFSEEHRAKISDAQRGEKHHFFGKSHTDDYKRKMSEALQGHSHSDETKAKIGDAHRGRIFSDAHRANIRKNHQGFLGKKHTLDAKRKIKEARLGKKHSDETKRKISEKKRKRDAKKRGQLLIDF